MKAYGRDTGRWCDAVAARAVIGWLLDVGATRQWIAARSGVAAVTLWRIESGRVERMHTRTLRRLEALARRVAAGDVHPPGERSSTPDRPCQQCGRRERNGGSRFCRTCLRHRTREAAHG